MASFTKSAKDLSKNPLGIIALFIVLVYGFACLLFGFSSASLTNEEKIPLIWFVVIFPIVVLIMFGWLVSQHHNKLYAPQDFRDDKSFLDAYQQPTSKTITHNEEAVKDIMEAGQEFKVVAEQERNIRADLTFRKVNHEGAAAELLIHSTAIAQVNTWFEKTYNTIFGSQISLLRKLSGYSGGILHKDIENHFIEAQSNAPDPLDNWDLNQYLHYLFDSKLVEEKGDSLIITDRGKDFLGILSVSGYSDDKAL